MTKRRITAHKGGRTANVPSGRIRPQTLQRIHATMRERGKSFADLVEESYDTQGDGTMYPKTMTIARSDYATDTEYSKAYQDAVKHYDCKAKVDDGNGGTGWKFFESAEDMRIWKNQK